VIVDLRRPIGNDAVATMRLTSQKGTVSEDYRGAAEKLPAAVADFLARSLQPSSKTLTAAANAYVAGTVYELRLDTPRALSEYRRAASLDPKMPEPKIAMARIAFAQGRWQQAIEIAEPLTEDRTLAPAQQCEVAALLYEVAPEHLRLRAVRERAEACANHSFEQEAVR
jgi:tetratricopeptide (TPR) repeat protein